MSNHKRKGYSMNMKKLSIVLLLSLGANLAQADSCNTNCNTDCSTSNDCSSSCSSDCNTDCNTDCNNVNLCDVKCVSSFVRPRSITTDLTYRNTGGTFYNKYHAARCNFFTWDSAFIYTRNRRGADIGRGFFGKNPLVFAEQGGDFNSLNLGLGSTENNGFKSTVCLAPRREVFAWLTQLWFNLDVCCTGLWADVSFAVESVRHKLNFREAVETPGNIPGQPTTVFGALQQRNAFSECATSCKRKTGVDDVMIRLGYDWTYCGNDHAGIAVVGVIPTGKKFDNAKFFQPLVGSKHGAIGVDLTADYTAWTDECSNSEAVLMTELLYLFRLKHKENRTFDFASNGPLSRFLLAATCANPASTFALNNLLTGCVRVEPRHQIEWWLAGRYQWCNWGFELSYNLFWRDKERLCPTSFPAFNDTSIFDMTCNTLTSNSTANVCQTQAERVHDAECTPIDPKNINLASGAARRTFSNTIAGSIAYENVWCECYPWYVSLSGRYEFASREKRRSTFEGWGVFGKAAISF
jgi:hypothetical protein